MAELKTFIACCRDGTGLEVTGEVVAHGLVLHGWIAGHPGETPGVDESQGFAISDPETGARVTQGADRAEALDHLQELIARYGGDEAFAAALKRGREAMREILEKQGK